MQIKRDMVVPLKRVAIALELDQYNVLQNNGGRASQTMFHAHVHLVPKPTAAAGLMVQRASRPWIRRVSPNGSGAASPRREPDRRVP